MTVTTVVAATPLEQILIEQNNQLTELRELDAAAHRAQVRHYAEKFAALRAQNTAMRDALTVHAAGHTCPAIAEALKTSSRQITRLARDRRPQDDAFIHDLIDQLATARAQANLPRRTS